MPTRAVIHVIPLIAAWTTGCASPPQPVPLAAHPHAGVRVLALDLDKMEAADASGFFISPNVLLTCNHVVAERLTLGVVLPDGRKLTIGKTVASDPASDLALVEVDGSLPPLRLSDRVPAKGEVLRAVTRYGESRATFTGLHDDPEVGQTYTLDAPELHEGASGGPIIDRTGAVVGIIRGGLDDDDKTHAVAVPAARVVGLLASRAATTRP